MWRLDELFHPQNYGMQTFEHEKQTTNSIVPAKYRRYRNSLKHLKHTKQQVLIKNWVGPGNYSGYSGIYAKQLKPLTKNIKLSPFLSVALLAAAAYLSLRCFRFTHFKTLVTANNNLPLNGFVLRQPICC